MRRAHPILISLLFLGLCLSVPLIQAALDLLDDGPPQVLELFERLPSAANLRRFEANLDDNSACAKLLRPCFQLVRYLLLHDMGGKALDGLDGWTFYHPDVKYLTEPYFRDLRPGTEEDPVAVIQDFAAQLKDLGIELLVVVIPGKPSIYPEHLWPRGKDPRRPSANTARFLSELAARQVAVEDAYPILHGARAQADRDGEKLFMATDTHWTGRGIREVARALAKRIQPMPWYARPVRSPRYERHKVRFTRQGDIPVMTQIPWQTKLFPEEEVEVDQVTDLDSKGLYQDDPASPVLLLGDSFSRIFQSDAPESAGLIANLAFELQIPLASLVNDGGASTQVRVQLSRDPTLLAGKKLIIWEFVERDVRFGMGGWQRLSLREPP